MEPLSPRASNDPYANLDGVFGKYLADEPKPLDPKRSDLEDLLT